MPGLDKDRFRNKTISFRMSPNERRQLESKIKVSGMQKGEYFRKMLLQGEIIIRVGKYESERLSFELKNMRTMLVQYMQNGDVLELKEVVMECIALLDELVEIKNNRENYN